MKIKRSKLKQLAIQFEGNDSLESQNKILIKIATARCARTSYTVVGEGGKEYSYEADIKLHDKLLADRHMSPSEHCAQAMPGIISRNFKGFKQYREIVETHS